MINNDFHWFGNIACTFNGIIGVKDRQLEISNEEDWRHVHKLRNQSAAVVVGSGTVLTDNPKILIKEEYIDEEIIQPIRVVFDRRGRLDHDSKIFSDQDIAKTIWVTNTEKEIQNIEKIPFESLDDCINLLEQRIKELDLRREIMVEGGAILLNSLCSGAKLSDLRVFRSPKIQLTGIKLFTHPVNFKLKLISCRKLGDGIEEIYTICESQGKMNF